MDKSIHNAFKICSFNSKGHRIDKIDYMKHLLTQCDVLLLQEHWYLERDIQLLEGLLGNVQVYGVSGMDDNELLSGRPYGGCAIVLSNNLKCNFLPIHISNRCCGGVLKLDHISILLFNIYMPCDTLYDYSNLDIFQNILNDISYTCSEHEDIDYVIIGGDFNTDLSRMNSLHTQALNNFVQNEELVFCDMSDTADILFTYENVSSSTESIIDHFIVSENMYRNLLDYRSIHDGNNLSDHAPILLSLNLVTSREHKCDVREYTKRPQWDKTTDSNIADYKHALSELFSHIKLPLNALYCQDTTC